MAGGKQEQEPAGGLTKGGEAGGRGCFLRETSRGSGRKENEKTKTIGAKRRSKNKKGFLCDREYK